MSDEDTLGLIFKALDNHIRRGILGAIHDWPGGLRSSQIAERFDIPWQGVSRHLRILTEAGLLRSITIPNGRLYVMNDDLLHVAAQWLRRVATPAAFDSSGKVIHHYPE